MKQVKFGVSGIFWRTHKRNGLKFDMLMYPNHLQNWLGSGRGLLIFLSLAAIFWGAHYRSGLGFGQLMYPDHLQNWFSYNHGLLTFFIFGGILTYWNRSNLRFLDILGEHMERLAWILTWWYIRTTFKVVRYWSWSVDFSNFVPSMSQSLSDWLLPANGCRSC